MKYLFKKLTSPSEEQLNHWGDEGYEIIAIRPRGGNSYDDIVYMQKILGDSDLKTAIDNDIAVATWSALSGSDGRIKSLTNTLEESIRSGFQQIVNALGEISDR